MALLRFLLLAVLVLLPAQLRAQTFLMMAEEPGCPWCARWDAEIAHIYPKTAEGRAAPLRRFDINEDPPEGAKLDGGVRFTPTFILVRDGAEAGRIEGYPGDEFFWVLLGQLLDRAGVAVEPDG